MRLLLLLTVAASAVAQDKIVFVKRFQFNSNHYYTDFINSQFLPGGNICLLDTKSGKVTEVVKGLEGGVFGRFDLSFDAKRIVFAWKKGADDGYRIYECGIDGSGLRQLTFPEPNETELVRKYQKGYHHGTDDMDPCYLPDGGICFISTRCQFGILCDGADVLTTTVLYRMDGDGKRIEKLTNSSVSEATPVVMHDGRIMYTRWEYVDKGAVSVKCLWAMRPDGSGSSEVYGNDISLPPTLIQGRPIPGSSMEFVVLGTPHYPQSAVGTVIRIDTTKNIRTREPMTYMTPDVDIQSEGGFAFRQADGSWKQDRTGKGPLFRDPYPLSKKLFLASHKPEGAEWNAAKGYALYRIEEGGRTELIYRDEAISCFQPVPLQPRQRPPVLSEARDLQLAAKGLAVCVVQDVYHGLENVQRGEAKWLRVMEQVPRPWAARYSWNGDSYDQQHVVVSKDAALGLKVQHGIVPVEADGSAHFTVPADRNIYFQLLDKNFMELQRERTYVNYRPGEKRSCIGCHEMPHTVPPPSNRSPLASLRPPSAPEPARPIHYPADVQPVWDKHCIKCHGGKTPKARLDLTGTPTALFSRSYESLMPERRKQPRTDRGLLGPIIGENHPKTGNVHYLPAKSLGSHASVLVAMLSRGLVRLADPKDAERAKKLEQIHNNVSLSSEEMLRVTTWIESNGQYYGSYWGRRNVQHKDHPNFRPSPTFAVATSMVSPVPEAER
ncbi:MAG: hypothetical protein FJ395_07700 [Verrucomicrobia bacterium]|nr:hypothetical protein [Verrucomicrobiota bacterium]